MGVIGQIAGQYASSAYSDVVVGIELMNEPLMSELPGGRGATQGYYQSGFDIVRQQYGGDSMVVIHDGFENPSSWNGFLSGQGTAGAIVDHHEYQVFDDGQVAWSPQQHVDYVWSHASQWATGQDKFVVAGEWTAAMTDCATFVNGYGVGARYDGTFPGSTYVGSCNDGINDISSWSGDQRSATTAYIQAQIQAYESYVQGWIFWNFKTESAGEWNLFGLIDNGIWPSM